jgi:hypothetical protein
MTPCAILLIFVLDLCFFSAFAFFSWLHFFCTVKYSTIKKFFSKGLAYRVFIRYNAWVEQLGKLINPLLWPRAGRAVTVYEPADNFENPHGWHDSRVSGCLRDTPVEVYSFYLSCLASAGDSTKMRIRRENANKEEPFLWLNKKSELI